jgi:hypothetical protein
VEVRSVEGVKRIGGRAMTYGRASKPLGHFIEQFEARAFAKSIGDQFVGVRATLEHQPHQLLASVDNGSMRLTPSRDALDYELDLCDTQACRDAWTMTNNRLLTGVERRVPLSQRLVQLWRRRPANPAYRERPVGCRIPDSGSGLRA